MEHTVKYDEYWEHTRSIVSNSCLEIAVKTRNAAEVLSAKGVSYPRENKIDVYNSGVMADGVRKEKDFIFICNKIIHAKEFRLDRQGNIKIHRDLLWWNGIVTIEGTDQKKKQWSFFFIILKWCDAILDFLNSTEEGLKEMQSISFSPGNFM